MMTMEDAVMAAERSTSSSGEVYRAVAHVEVRDAISRLGYNLEDNDDMRRFADDLRWAAEQRAAQERRAASGLAALLAFFTAAVGAAITLVAQWISSRMGSSSH